MPTQRDAFLDNLYEIAKADKQIILLSADFGAPSLDKWRRDLPNQFINTGIAEQNTINVARGLAMAGKTVYTYAILPFYMRAYEQIRHLCMQNLNVNMIGVGAGFAYDTAGPTHHALEDIAAMCALPNITILNASDSNMAAVFAKIAYENLGSKYIRLDRTKDEIGGSFDFSLGLRKLHTIGNDVTIIATGYMVIKALKVSEQLANQIGARVIDLYRIKPVNRKLLLEQIAVSKKIVTLEENFLNSGIGSMIAEILAEEGIHMPFKRIGVHDQYYFNYAGREELHRLCRLDADSIVKGILEWLETKNVGQ